MNKYLSKKAVTLALLSSFAISATHASVLVLGSESELSTVIANINQEEVRHFDNNQSETDVLYVNVGTSSEQDLALAQQQIVDGQLVVLDLSTLADPKIRTSYTKRLTGMGVSAPVVISGNSYGQSVLNSVSGNEAEEAESIKRTLASSLVKNFNYGSK